MSGRIVTKERSQHGISPVPMLIGFYLGIFSKTLEQIPNRAVLLQTKLALSKEQREMLRPNRTARPKKKKPKWKNGKCGYLSWQA